MAELIKTTDSLNDGRKKLNDAITDSNAALSTANTAKQTANLAKAESESTQTQLDTIVIEGDSSVEAAQARVNNSGTAFATLKQRLDAEHQEVTAQLQQTEYHASNFGVIGDGLTVDNIAFKNAIEVSKNSSLKLAKESTIRLTEPVVIACDRPITIDGNNSTIIFDGVNDSVIMKFSGVPYHTIYPIETLQSNQTKILVEDATIFSIGDGVVIKSNEIFAERKGYVEHYKKGFASKIRDIQDNYIIIDEIPYDLNYGHALTIDFYKNYPIKIKNITFVNNSGSANKNSLRMSNIFSGEVKDIRVSNDDFAGIIISNSVDLLLDNVSGDLSENDNVALNYGIFIENSSFLRLKRLDITSLRHCVTLTNSPSVQIEVSDSRLHSLSGASIDSHSSWSYTVINSYLDGHIYLGVGHATFDNCKIQFGKQGQFGVSTREDVSELLRGFIFKNCEMNVASNESPYYLFKIADTHTEKIGKITVMDCLINSDTEIDIAFALRHAKMSENCGDITISNNDFNCNINMLFGYFGDIDNVKSVGNANKKNINIKNNTFKKINAISNALNLFSSFMVKNNAFLGVTNTMIRPIVATYISNVLWFVDNEIMQGNMAFEYANILYCKGNIVHYHTVESFVKNVKNAIVTNNILNGSPMLNFAENTGNTIQVGWNRRAGRVATTVESNLPSGYINLE